MPLVISTSRFHASYCADSACGVVPVFSVKVFHCASVSVFHCASVIGTQAGVAPVIVAGGFGIPIMLPAPSYVGVAHAVPTEFVMPVISFTLLAVRV